MPVVLDHLPLQEMSADRYVLPSILVDARKEFLNRCVEDYGAGERGAEIWNAPKAFVSGDLRSVSASDKIGKCFLREPQAPSFAA